MSKSRKTHDEKAGQENGQPVDAAPDGAATPHDEMLDESSETVGDDDQVAEAAPDPLAVLAAERDEYKEKWLRVVAELDNVRKRSSREVLQSRKFAQADVLRGFLEILDNFERALQSLPAQADTDAPGGVREGVELIHQRLRGLMTEKGVAPMEVLGSEFDPNFHEAVGQLPREGVAPGLVIEVVQQGYNFGDLVLRPARVIISA